MTTPETKKIVAVELRIVVDKKSFTEIKAINETSK
jgi:hypothetical protein